MSIKTLWIILLKIIGIWLISQSIVILPYGITALAAIGSYFDDSFVVMLVITALIGAISASYYLILKLFIFNPHWILRKLKLDKGIEDEVIDLNIKQETIMVIVFVIIGGLVLIDSIPYLIRYTLACFQEELLLSEDPNLKWVIFYLLKTVFGYLLISENALIVKFITKQQQKVLKDNTSDNQ